MGQTGTVKQGEKLFPTHTLYLAHAHTIISDVCTGRYSHRYRQVLIQVQAGTHTGTGRYSYRYRQVHVHVSTEHITQSATLTCCPLSVLTTRVPSRSHLLPNIIITTSQPACYEVGGGGEGGRGEGGGVIELFIHRNHKSPAIKRQAKTEVSQQPYMLQQNRLHQFCSAQYAESIPDTCSGNTDT